MAVTQYPFTGTGSTRVFPVGVKILSDDYVRIDINGTSVLDTTAFDIINNSIVFQTPPAPSAVIIVWVADSFESIADLGTTNNVDLVGLNMDSIIITATNIDVIITSSQLPTMSVATGEPGTEVIYNTTTNTLTVPRGDVGATGLTGLTGEQGTSIDHISRTVGTGLPGSTDTYTAWADLAETISLGTFDVYNGRDGDGVNPADVLTDQDVIDVQNLSGVNTGDQDISGKANLTSNVFTGIQVGIITAEDNAIDFTVTNGFSLTATATLITVGTMALKKGQEGSFTVHSAENITGWGVEFLFAPNFSAITPTPPPTPLGTMEFWYKIIEVIGVDGGIENIIYVAWAQ